MPRIRQSSPDTGRPAPPHRERTVAVAALAALALAVWVSTLVDTGPALRDLALFAHLGSLILGFGTVLVADYFFALWALRRTTFPEAVASTARLHPLIWAGLAGLITSGVLLRPDLESGSTILKLCLVATLTVNGVQATALSRRLKQSTGTPPTRLLIWGGLTSAISQTCWWGAIVIGFLNVNQ